MLEVQRDPFRRGLEVRLGAVGEGEGEAVAEEQGADAAALVGGVDGEVEEVCCRVELGEGVCFDSCFRAG